MKMYLKNYLKLAVFILFTGLITAQETDADYIRANYNKEEVYITMRDGIRLFTSIYSPKDTLRKYPVLMNRTPYNVGPYGKNEFKKVLGPSDNLTRDGYIFVYQDVRGKFMSEGEYMDVRPFNPDKKGTETDEASDTYDTIEWLLKNQKNFNGRVGLYGISYPGFYVVMGLLSRHPAIKAASPQAPIADWFIGDDFRHNGAFFLNSAFPFYYVFGKERDSLTTKWGESFKFPHDNGYKFYLETGALKNFNSKYLKDSVKFWLEVTENDTYNDFWKARTTLPHLNNIVTPILTVGGLFDAEDCYGALKTYEAIERNSPDNLNFIVMGPWFHGGWERSDGDSLGSIYFGSKTSQYYNDSIIVPFFSYFLKAKGHGYFTEASVFETGANKWNKLESWPPDTAQAKSLYLNPGGILTDTAASGWNYDEFISDPENPVPFTRNDSKRMNRGYMVEDQRFLSGRRDVLTYYSDVLKDDLTVSGEIEADIFVSTSSTDADWVVKIADVFPENDPLSADTLKGFEMLVRGEPFRGKFRNSFEKPEPFIPDRVTNIKFKMPAVNHTFKAGHRIMVQIHSSWFPLVDRNPQKFMKINLADDNDYIKAVHRLFYGGKSSSRVILPVR